jgi:hypothetical protein
MARQTLFGGETICFIKFEFIEAGMLGNIIVSRDRVSVRIKRNSRSDGLLVFMISKKGDTFVAKVKYVRYVKGKHTSYGNPDTNYIQRGQVVFKEPRRDYDGCYFFRDSGDRHGHYSGTLDDADQEDQFLNWLMKKLNRLEFTHHHKEGYNARRNQEKDGLKRGHHPTEKFTGEDCTPVV